MGDEGRTHNGAQAPMQPYDEMRAQAPPRPWEKVWLENVTTGLDGGRRSCLRPRLGTGAAAEAAPTQASALSAAVKGIPAAPSLNRMLH